MESITIDNTHWTESISEYIKLKESMINKLNANISPKSDINAIFVPHAGFAYSALCSMAAYREVFNRDYKVVILLCTYHDGNKVIIPEFTKIELNNFEEDIEIEINTNIVRKLSDFTKGYDEFMEEHSFSNQLPFIALFKNVPTLVPILCGSEGADTIADKIYEIIKGKNDYLIICTSDLSHVNGTFTRKIVGENIQGQIREVDSYITKALCLYDDKNEKNEKDYISTSACGINAIYIFRRILSEMESQFYPRLVCYYNSQNIASQNIFTINPQILVEDIENNPNESSVSYASIIYTSLPYINESDDRTMQYLLTDFDKLQLIKYAMDSTKNKFVPIPHILPVYSQSIQQKRALFVTIEENKNKKNKLRGCIGTLSLTESIVNNTNTYAIQTAFNDSRFSPMTEKEVFSDNYIYKINILSNLKPITLEEYLDSDGKKYIEGKDGIYLEVPAVDNKDGRSTAYFLPSVIGEQEWSSREEQGWSPREEQLKNLCKKMYQSYEEGNECYNRQNIVVKYNEGFEFSFKNIGMIGGHYHRKYIKYCNKIKGYQ